MRYYKIVDDNGNIVAVGTGDGGAEITEQEYNEIISAPVNAEEEITINASPETVETVVLQEQLADAASTIIDLTYELTVAELGVAE